MFIFLCLYFKLANIFLKGCTIMWKHHKEQSFSLFLSFIKRRIFKLWVLNKCKTGHFWNERFCQSSSRKLNPFAGKWKQHFINLLSNSIVVNSSFHIVICPGFIILSLPPVTRIKLLLCASLSSALKWG